nr:MAG TPA: hypothetical protein [Caudoviricetes sp.]
MPEARINSGISGFLTKIKYYGNMKIWIVSNCLGNDDIKIQAAGFLVVDNLI